jgi:acetolactate synthase-1/2/3 large subunit
VAHGAGVVDELTFIDAEAAVEDLVPTLEAAFAGGGVHLVDVPIDYSENTRVLVDELRNRTPDVECA